MDNIIKLIDIHWTKTKTKTKIKAKHKPKHKPKPIEENHIEDIEMYNNDIMIDKSKSQMLKVLDIELKESILCPNVENYKPIKEIIDYNNKIIQIQTKDFIRGQTFIKDNIQYKIINISTCKEYSSEKYHIKLLICGYNDDLNKKIEIICSLDHVFNLDSNSNILIY